MEPRLIESRSWAEFSAAVAAAVSAGDRVVISGARPSGGYAATAEAPTAEG